MNKLNPSSSGFRLSPGDINPGATTFAAYASGIVYALTATSALLDFGTTDPSITIAIPGTYIINARIRVDYNAATFAAVRTVTLKLRRTNNTAADLTNGSAAFKTEIITTLTYTGEIVSIPLVIYTTLNSDDIIQIFGSIDVVPSAGSIDCAEAEIIAVKIN